MAKKSYFIQLKDYSTYKTIFADFSQNLRKFEITFLTAKSQKQRFLVKNSYLCKILFQKWFCSWVFFLTKFLISPPSPLLDNFPLFWLFLPNFECQKPYKFPIFQNLILFFLKKKITLCDLGWSMNANSTNCDEIAPK